MSPGQSCRLHYNRCQSGGLPFTGSQISHLGPGHGLFSDTLIYYALLALPSSVCRVDPFVPPRKKFELLMVTLDLDFVKAGSKGEQIDAPKLAEKLQKLLTNQARTSVLLSSLASYELGGKFAAGPVPPVKSSPHTNPIPWRSNRC